MISTRIDVAARTVREGGVIAYPTESCYGLGCDPFNKAAVARILQLKQRSQAKGLILVADDRSRFDSLLNWPKQSVLQTIIDSWPGPVTWLIPTLKQAPNHLTGKHNTLAVRVSSHPLVQALCNACESALVSTSANPEGRVPAKTVSELTKYFGENAIDYILEGELGDDEQPSTIIDALSGSIIRA